MKKDIILTGVGGQGIVTIATVIGYAAVSAKLFFKQSEVHGMSQRGGSVQSNFRLSDKKIYSDLIPQGRADMIISVEPMEALRYLPWLSKNGWLITNTKPYVNILNYPDLDKLLEELDSHKNVIAFDADKYAKEIGSIKSANILILGAASKYLDIDFVKFEDAVKTLFARKDESVIEKNIEALQLGKKIADGDIKI